MFLGGTSKNRLQLIVKRRGCSLCCTRRGVGRGINGDNSDVREVTFEADVHDSFRNRVEIVPCNFFVVIPGS